MNDEVNNMIGQERFQDINRLLNKRLEEKKVLIAAHRGSWSGNIVNNTIPAYVASLKMHADMFECDLISTLDGVLYTIHDGFESINYGFHSNSKTFYSKEIDSLQYLNHDGVLSGYYAEKFEDVLKYFQNGELFNVDRAWSILPEVAKMMDKYPSSVYQAIIKTPPQKEYLDFFENYPTKFMYMPIVRSMDDVRLALSYKNINTVGVELIAPTTESELFQDENIKWIKEQGLFCWANTIKLGGFQRYDLFGGLDDDMAIVNDPKESWGKIMDKGINVMQTDWPAILSDFRDQYV